MGGSWDIPNMDCEPGKSKWLAKRNPEETPHKSNSNCLEGATQGLSLSSPCVYPHTLCSFPPNEYFTCFATFRLRGNSFPQSRRARGLVMSTGLVTRIQCFYHHDPTQSLAGNWSPPPSHCRPRPLQIRTTLSKRVASSPWKCASSKLRFALSMKHIGLPRWHWWYRTCLPMKVRH